MTARSLVKRACQSCKATPQIRRPRASCRWNTSFIRWCCGAWRRAIARLLACPEFGHGAAGARGLCAGKAQFQLKPQQFRLVAAQFLPQDGGWRLAQNRKDLRVARVKLRDF